MMIGDDTAVTSKWAIACYAGNFGFVASVAAAAVVVVEAIVEKIEEIVVRIAGGSAARNVGETVGKAVAGIVGKVVEESVAVAGTSRSIEIHIVAGAVKFQLAT